MDNNHEPSTSTKPLLLTIDQYRWARRIQQNSTNDRLLAIADERLFGHYAALRALNGE